jgi:hypothetical protein
MKPYPGQTEKRNGTFVLTQEQKEWFCRWFPETENSRIAKAMGVSVSSLHRIKRKLGLAKSDKGMKAIKRRQAAHIKKVCQENGYYESLKGRQPSEKCKAAYREYLRSERFVHPLLILKEKNPRLYRKKMDERSRIRKELIGKERWRSSIGLEQTTRMNLPQFNYTRKEVNRRFLAKRRGYILGDYSERYGERFTLYFDKDTNRTELFEKNCMADGFKIMELTE